MVFRIRFLPTSPWSPGQYFANALTESSNSLVASQNGIKKVYFPRLIIPLGSVIAGLVDFCFAFRVLIGMMYHYGIAPSRSILLFPVFLLLAIATALAVGLWLLTMICPCCGVFAWARP
jgi:lipopolysaccharide transport system permease protein